MGFPYGSIQRWTRRRAKSNSAMGHSTISPLAPKSPFSTAADWEKAEKACDEVGSFVSTPMVDHAIRQVI